MLKKPNITYTGEINLTNKLGEVLELFIASYELFELFQHVQDSLNEKYINWIQQNFFRVLHTVFKLIGCKTLQDYCLESISASKYFPSLDKEILFDLLKRDDLQVEEIVTPGLEFKGNDLAKWSQENFEKLKEKLSQYITLIRFVGISRIEFFDKVLPYKAAIPLKIYEEVEEYHYTILKSTTLPLTQED
ncbi:7773_t:CDS:2 [Funneliformis geosporum]|uniref:7773_t:CDS:1 n=1 Tax=Funneliformis geosporum TaxID=1117311 RepID=A0A9W4WU23_9GLOM|nr:7773_t:CDS:2 [Funneliformis geosporum]